jgi:hypothetical protein
MFSRPAICVCYYYLYYKFTSIIVHRLDNNYEALQSIIYKDIIHVIGDDEDDLQDTTIEDEINQSNSRKTKILKKVIIYSHIVINLNQDGMTMFLF